MARLEKPTPRPLAFQASGGPDSGHFVSSPDSWVTSSRLGPRHWGHSGEAAARAVDVARMRTRAAAGRGESLNIPDLLPTRRVGTPSYQEPVSSRRKFSVTARDEPRRESAL